jgi:hypothetical protein
MVNTDSHAKVAAQRSAELDRHLATIKGNFPKSPFPKSHRALIRAIMVELSRRDPDGTWLGGSTTNLEQAAVLATDRVLDPSLLWVEHLGAFYDTATVRSLLARDGESVTRQAVHKRKGLLALTTGSGKVVYPAFQFRDRQLVHGLDRVQKELPEPLVSRWTLASWLVTPERDLGDERPIDVLFDESQGSVDDVVRVARIWATQLAN